MPQVKVLVPCTLQDFIDAASGLLHGLQQDCSYWRQGRQLQEAEQYSFQWDDVVRICPRGCPGGAKRILHSHDADKRHAEPDDNISCAQSRNGAASSYLSSGGQTRSTASNSRSIAQPSQYIALSFGGHARATEPASASSSAGRRLNRKTTLAPSESPAKQCRFRAKTPSITGTDTTGRSSAGLAAHILSQQDPHYTCKKTCRYFRRCGGACETRGAHKTHLCRKCHTSVMLRIIGDKAHFGAIEECIGNQLTWKCHCGFLVDWRARNA